MGSMYMSEELLSKDLLSTHYKKFWTVGGGKEEKESRKHVSYRKRSYSVGSGVAKTKRKAEFQDSEVVSVNSNAPTEVVDKRKVQKGQQEEDMVSTKGFARLDMTTLQNIGWSSKANDDKPDRTIVNVDDFYKLTNPVHISGSSKPMARVGKKAVRKQVEFRRLQEQVRDVSMNLRNKFRTSAYQKLYQRPNGENTSQVYRSQLAASLRAFQPKEWPALNHQELNPTFFRCKPVQPSTERPSTSRPRSGTPARLQRPKSVPASCLQARNQYIRRCETPSNVHPGRFDTLSPFVISDLLRKSEAPASNGSENDSTPDEKSPLIEILHEETRQLAETERDDDASTTSGIDSAASDNDVVSSETDSDFEPVIIADVNIPELNLRPEKLDAIYVPEPKRGWRQFDFDMSNIDVPPYHFKSPFPDYLDDIDLKQMAKQKWNWRHHLKQRTGPRPSDLEGMLDRLVELEKLQMDTVAWEQKRTMQMRKSASRRAGSAKIKDRRCCSQCLQATCCGDCPEKLVQSNTCDFCRQSLCTGTCKEVTYDQRMRQSRLEDERPITPKIPFPRACNTCQKKNTSKYINANNLILGQPRFNNATFSRGQNAYKVRDLRPKSETGFSQDVVKEFEKLGLETTQPSRPSTAMSVTRPRSRNSLYPGKSFNSQRKNSITETDKPSVLRKRRSKSARNVRPKTAA